MGYKDATHAHSCFLDTYDDALADAKCNSFLLSSFPADSLFLYHIKTVKYYSPIENELGVYSGARFTTLTLPQTNLVYQDQTDDLKFYYLLFYNPDLSVYETYIITD